MNLAGMELKDSEIFKEIGERVKHLRKAKGYSSYESFAFDHDVPRMQYWRMERGTENITIKSLLKILRIHKITLMEFFAEDFYDRHKLPKKMQKPPK